MKRPTLEIIIHEHRKHKDGTCPLLLRVTFGRIPRTIGLGISMTEKNFEAIWIKPSPRDNNLTQRNKLNTNFIQKSLHILDQMEKEGIESFDFDEFRDRFKGRKLEMNSNLLNMYERIINEYKSEGRIGTADTYKHSRRALLNYFNKTNTKDAEIKYNSIKTKELRGFDNYLIRELNRSETTLSIYLRCLRAVYNKAIKEGIISTEISPFNDKINPYIIRTPKNVKKALLPEEIIKLSTFYDFQNSIKIRARDFWLLMFYCYGMNICDILHLKNKNLDGNTLNYKREKTKRTSRKDAQPVIIALNENAINIINKYRNEDHSPDSYLFPTLDQIDTASKVRDKIKNFNRSINKHIKIVAEQQGITTNISANFARHSFATIARNRGTKAEIISAMLAHSDISTTQNYLDSLKSDHLKELTDKIYANL